MRPKYKRQYIYINIILNISYDSYMPKNIGAFATSFGKQRTKFVLLRQNIKKVKPFM